MDWMRRRRADGDRVPGVLRSAGFEEIEIRETHRVHVHAAAAIIRARKPGADG